MRLKTVLKVLAHVAALAGIWIFASFSVFLGLQVDGTYGNIGLLTSAALFALYVWLGFFRRK